MKDNIIDKMNKIKKDIVENLKEEEIDEIWGKCNYHDNLSKVSELIDKLETESLDYSNILENSNSKRIIDDLQDQLEIAEEISSPTGSETINEFLQFIMEIQEYIVFHNDLTKTIRNITDPCVRSFIETAVENRIEIIEDDCSDEHGWCQIQENWTRLSYIENMYKIKKEIITPHILDFKPIPQEEKIDFGLCKICKEPLKLQRVNGLVFTSPFDTTTAYVLVVKCKNNHIEDKIDMVLENLKKEEN